MAYPFDHRRYRLPFAAQKSVLEPAEWRCHECGKLLGVRHGARLHIRLQRHNYLVSLPVEATCHGCGTKNRT
jgi:RNase P subunit RPR2